MNSNSPLDVIIVGAGFAGIYQAWRYRQLGMSVRVFEMEAEAGGVWAGNRYPGARVDISPPSYEFSMDVLWKDWYWNETFPSRYELTDYFRHCVDKLEIKDSIQFKSKVTSAHFENDTNSWNVTINDREQYRSSFLIFCTGPASAPYVPDFKNFDVYEGECHHSGMWPEGLNFDGKRVAIIGTGASGIQMVQEAGLHASHLTVFQRTPINGIPMRQQPLSREIQDEWKKEYPEKFKVRNATPGGSLIQSTGKRTDEVSEAEMLAAYEASWEHGGFGFWGTFYDVFYDPAANRKIYEFWRDKVRARLNDPEVREILAPMDPVAPFGAKRPSLEINYYDVFNQDNVELVNLAKVDIEAFTPKGLRTSDGREFEFDLIALATGFDALTGPLTRIDLRGDHGQSIADHWSDGARTQLGIATHGFPNLWFLYGPQSPNNTLIGPTSAELQGEWLVQCIKYLRENDIVRIDPTSLGEDNWDEEMNNISGRHFMSTVSNWQTGGNIPGKKRKLLVHLDSVSYLNSLNEAAQNNYTDFKLTKRTEIDAGAE